MGKKKCLYSDLNQNQKISLSTRQKHYLGICSNKGKTRCSEGQTASELVSDFQGAVDDYVSACLTEGKEPEKAIKGSFNVRLSSGRHRAVVINATSHQILLNSFVEDCIVKWLTSSV